MIVLDTNVVSELMLPWPSPVVEEWVRHQAGTGELQTTSVTVAEIRYGIARLPEGARGAQLRADADDVLTAFAGQILPFDHAAAVACADLVAARDRMGAPIAILDAQIAAIARSRRARLATRNTKDFTGTGVELIDPWQQG